MIDGSAETVQYRILGPVDVAVGARRLAVPGAIRRGLLGFLVLNAGRTVTLAQIVRALWHTDPPATATAQVHAAVSAVRRVLRAAGVAGDLVTQSPGYRLAVAAQRTDVGAFEELVRRAREAAGAREAAALIEDALALWRGMPLADAAGEFTRGTVTRLEQVRLGAIEELHERMLDLGRHRELIPTLRAAVAEHPLRERPWAQLMIALYRDGQQAEALHAYRDLRARLARDHGIDPQPSLAELYTRILNADPALAAAPPPDARPGRVSPAQLPPDTADLTGRDEPVAELVRLLTAPEEAATSVRTCVVTGVGGVGKTTLAVRVAHLVRTRYPDGQLYVDLRGGCDAPVPPATVLGMFLRALGVDPVPPTEQERAALLRSLLAGRRMLLVLDNARDAGQVKPLLPGSPTCAVLITSRQQIRTIPGAHVLALDVLAPAEATALLRRLMPAGEAADALTETARLCAYLPLALRIVGARAGGYPPGFARTLVERLADERGRLSELELHDLSVRCSFALSYRLLGRQPDGTDPARAFRLLGLLDSAGVTLDAAAHLLDLPPADTRRTLDVLIDAQLLRAERSDRFRMHDLVRLYAGECAAADEPAGQRDAAIRRLLRRYLAFARQAGPLVQPALDDDRPPTGPVLLNGRREALDWFDVERSTVVSALRHAATAPDGELLAAELVVALRWLFRSQGYDEQWEWALRLALRVARSADARVLVAVAASELALVCAQRGDDDDAFAFDLESLAAFRAAGDRLGEIRALNNVGAAYHRDGAHHAALAHYRHALDGARAEGSLRSQAYLLANIAAVQRDNGRPDDAIHEDTRALEICRAAGDRHAEVDVLEDLAASYRAAGRFADAIVAHEEAITLAEELGDRPRYRAARSELAVTRASAERAGPVTEPAQ